MGELQYQSGFNNTFESEAIAGALPRGANSPQKPPLGLFAEQLSGTAFTAPRRNNFRSWLYRILPSVTHGEFVIMEHKLNNDTDKPEFIPPDPMRWQPLPDPTAPSHFIDGLVLMASGGITGASGCNIYHYAFNHSMDESFFYSSDGEFLIIPQQGDLHIATELGPLKIVPGEIAVIPRGVKFQVDTSAGVARGYACENMGAPFELPSLGPIGANGLANPRDFLYPTAAFREAKGAYKIINKFQGKLWQAPIDHDPLDVVAWHGNYAPYKYDLRLFNTINTVSFDHPDPSIFTVLTSPSDTVGTANIDFVIFPPRWMVAENTFRPPYYHRNIMNEYMGLIYGVYDAKKDGFVPGGSSLHNCMTAHGPDKATFEKATEESLSAVYQGETLAFMLESRHVFCPSKFALECSQREKDYYRCWQGISANFKHSLSSKTRGH